MKKSFYLLGMLMISFFTIHTLEAQIKTPASSPRTTLKQEVGLIDITIDYSRPGVKDRKIFGEMLPYGQFWRTGANSPTRVSFSGEVMIGGQKLAQGTYSLFTYPGADQWTVIFSNSTGLPGANGYDQSNDAVRILIKPEALDRTVETFTIDVANIRNNTATIDLSWEKTRVSIPVALNTDEKVFASIDQTMNGPSANDYFGAASYYFGAGKDLDKALEWVQKAVKMTDGKFYWMLHMQAQIQAAMGKKQDAVQSANASLRAAKSSGDNHYILLNNNLLKELGS